MVFELKGYIATNINDKEEVFKKISKVFTDNGMQFAGTFEEYKKGTTITNIMDPMYDSEHHIEAMRNKIEGE